MPPFFERKKMSEKKKYILSLLALAVFLSFLAVAIFFSSLKAAIPKNNSIEWPKNVIYFVLLDRFHDGNTLNNYKVDTKNPEAYQGGDIAGLIQKIPYLKELGITAIWLSPVLDNRDLEFFGKYAYHGYWPKNPMSLELEEHFGTWQELTSLAKELKKNDIHLILDIIVNHVGYDSHLVKEKAHWFDQKRNLHGLPCFDHTNKEVRDLLINASLMWIRQLKPAGFRLDAVKHVSKSFWEEYNQKIRDEKSDFFLLAEVCDGNTNTCIEYSKLEFTSIIDYPLYHVALRVMSGKTAEELGDLFFQDRYYSHDARFLGTFLDNHDVDRFLTAMKGDIERFKLGISFLFSIRGIPILYYGTEVGMQGEGDPDNRKMMEFGKNREIREYVKKCIQTRLSSSALTSGIQVHLWQSPCIYAFARVFEDQIAFVVLNNGDASQQVQIPLEALDSFLVNAKYKDTTSLHEATIEGTKLALDIPAKRCLIFLTPSVSGKYAKLFEKCVERTKNPKMVETIFEVTMPTHEAKEVYVIGGSPVLGQWNTQKAAGPMTLVKDNIYQMKFLLPQGSIVKYKYIEKKVNWEGGSDRYIQIPWEKSLKIQDQWRE